MLQLTEIKEETNVQDPIFTLTFEDENLPEEAWPIMKNNLETYKYGVNNGEIEAAVQVANNHINLIITLPNTMSTEKFDNTLEELKINFQKYYSSLKERIHLIPLLIS